MIETGVRFKNGTAASAAAPVVMFPPESKLIPAVTGYRITGDHANALFNIYAGGLVSHCKVSASAQAILLVNSTVGFTAGNKVMILTPAGLMYWNSIASVQAGVSLTLDANVGLLTTVNDVVYRMDMIASLPCGSATVNNAGAINGLVFGHKGMPLAGAIVAGTAANIITRFSVAYQRR